MPKRPKPDIPPGAAKKIAKALGDIDAPKPRKGAGGRAPGRPARPPRRPFNRDEQARRMPRHGANGDRTTYGRAVDSNGNEYSVNSGDKHRDRALIDATNDRLRERGLLPGRANSARASDAEQKFATTMRQNGVREADLVINNPDGPCRQRLGCDQSLPALLDPGQRLTVHWRDASGAWQSKTYEGMA